MASPSELNELTQAPPLSRGSDIATRRVGVPVAEANLMHAFLATASTLFPPGGGRSLYALTEPEIGQGRPDALLITASPRALQSHFQRGLRLRTLTEARLADASLPLNMAGVSADHARHLRKSLTQQGWPKAIEARAAKLPIIHDSIVIEAKVDKWQRGIEQAARFRWSAARAYLVLPDNITRRVADRSLGFYNVGVISMGEPAARVVSPSMPASIAPTTEMWLLELLRRGLERGDAYRLTKSSNLTSAS